MLQLKQTLDTESDRRIRVVPSTPVEAIRYLAPPLSQRGLVNIDMGNWSASLGTC